MKNFIKVRFTDAPEWPVHCSPEFDGTMSPARFASIRNQPVAILTPPKLPSQVDHPPICDTDFVWLIPAAELRRIGASGNGGKQWVCRHQIQIGD